MPRRHDGPVRIGCSGWSYAHWREPVYGGAPSGRWLGLYAERFPTVEVNATFYRLPTPRDGAGLGGARARGIRVRGQDEPLHDPHPAPAGRRPDVGAATSGSSRWSGGKLGPVLWQLPANFRRDEERLADALERLPDGRALLRVPAPVLVLPRTCCELLRAHGAALVDRRPPERPFQTLELTADWAYVRFHYGSRGRRGNYSETELDEWAERIRGWRGERRGVRLLQQRLGGVRGAERRAAVGVGRTA